MKCRFVSSDGREWSGRYDRIPGDECVFHLRYQYALQRFWPLAQRTVSGATVQYWFSNDPGIEALAQMV